MIHKVESRPSSLIKADALQKKYFDQLSSFQDPPGIFVGDCVKADGADEGVELLDGSVELVPRYGYVFL